MSIRYPPGPTNFNAWIGCTWRHAFSQCSHPLEFVTELARTYGDIVFYRLFCYQAYQVNHPDLIHEVLVTKADSFKKQPRQLDFIRSVAGDGILTMEGERWVRQRRMMLPAFQSQSGQQMAETAVDEVQRMLAGWGEGREICVGREMTDLMIRTVGRVFFGMQSSKHAERLREALHTLGDSMLDLDYRLDRLAGWFPSFKKRRRREANRVLDEYFDEAIGTLSKEPASQQHLLALMMCAVNRDENGIGMTKEQVRSEARTMFYAGHHTAAANLTWTLILLARHPEVRSRLLAEIDDVLNGEPPQYSDLPRLTYTEQVIQESMRLYPPAWALFTREAVEDVQIGSYVLPRGAWVYMYPWVVHRDPRFFPDPLRFDPARFAPDRAKQIPAGAYIPFGLGSHSCIGSRMAMTALKLTLAAIHQHFELKLSPGQPPVKLHTSISLRPQQGVRLLPLRR